MGSAAAMHQVQQILQQRTEPQIVVVSAMSGTTDQLIRCGELAAGGHEQYRDILKEIEQRHFESIKELIPVQQQSSILSLVKKACNEIEDISNGIFLLGEYTARSKDKLMSYGELLSSQLFAYALQHAGADAAWVDARSLIRTNSRYGNAIVDVAVTQQQLRSFFQQHQAAISVVPGFIASNPHGITTTLGRGGSDYTAAIIAGALHASVLEIWTDVSGMMTADPRWVPNARIIPSISYQEAMELSHFGAKVLYPPTIQPVVGLNIPICIKNTFAPSDAGTRIESTAVRDNIIRGISSINSIALLSLEGSGMVGIPGISARLFEALATAGINVILITQSSSEHSICVGISTSDAVRAKEVVDQAFQLEIETGKIDPLQVENGLSIVALVGDNMKHHTGVSGRMFSALGRNGINIRAIAQGSTERNISVVVDARDVRKAINVLHEEFFEAVKKQLHLFVTGTGNVGRRLLEQLLQQRDYLEEQLHLQIRVCGISNSRRMRIDENGIDLSQWEQLLQEAPAADLQQYVQAIIDRNLPNSVFADITANETVAQVYRQLLEKSISVVACNKIAASSPYVNYKILKDVAREYNASFLFETNVGAGLPVIGTLNDLLRSGDRVLRIEAVLSGTLNFVFNNYDGSRSFAAVVKQAQNEGYTEPDPRLDLSGTDVMRKILILAREAGEVLEMHDIHCNGFLPEACFEGDVAAFYKSMEANENHFKGILEAAQQAGTKLKFVACFERAESSSKASVGLQHIAPESDFYHLYGKDNLVLFYTERYREQPLVVKGAGAGAAVTASGVFADILRSI